MDEKELKTGGECRLKDGLLLKKTSGEDGKTEDVLLKDFEVIPATADTAISAIVKSGGDDVLFNKILLCERVKISGLPENAWNASTLSQLSVADYVIIKEEVDKFDNAFTFTPPTIRV